MTITLGGITISDNMYLSGLETNKQVIVDKQRNIDGVAIVRVKPTPGGRELTLGTQNQGGAIQGIWEWSTIEQIKSLELLAQSVILNYRGTNYSVYITGTDLSPFLQFEIEGASKKFTGVINLLEG
jgi:hypothetical protein